MKTAQYDVTGLGNAIVDILARSDEAFLERHQLKKGTMALIEREQADALYAQLENAVEKSGGSAGNTMAGLASLGGKGAYVGKVANDALGQAFTRDIREIGLRFDTSALDGGAPTARCIVLVTPDAQRTMNTYLGACTELGPADVDLDLIRDSEITYLEGYLWDKPGAKEACLLAMNTAHAAGRRVALSLSDPFCVERHRRDFVELVQHHVDVLFANEAEICALYQCNDLSTAARTVRDLCEVAALTRSADGALVVTPEATFELPAEPVSRVVDTTGAGDLYAAGFLFALTHRYSPAESGRWGALCAAEVISHFGARPELNLKDWVAKRL